MAKPTRFTPDMYEEYLSKGLWTLETTSDLWDKNAMLFPNREAFVDDRRRVTWVELKVLSDRLALRLLDLGLQRDEFLFSLLPNYVEAYIIRTACEKAGVLCGSALLTIREAEIGYVLKQFKAVAIAVPREFRGFPFLDAVLGMRPEVPGLRHMLVLGADAPRGTISLGKLLEEFPPPSHPPELLKETRIRATEISVVGFTSGTTGMPKGSEHVQCARMAMARAYGERPKINKEDIVLNIISPVGGLSSAFCYNGSAGLVGAKVVLVDVWSPEATFDLIERERVTILLAVPAQLAKMVLEPQAKNRDFRSLRCICTSTAPLAYNLAQEAENIFGVPVLNLYGQFDAGLISGVSIDDPPQVRWGTVGKPFKENILRIVDENGNDVPPGAEGEILYTGPTASSGYYQDLEATLKVWGCLGKDGLCHSGDIGRLDEEGNLILVGRKKDIIIRGGQNIYPAEIEGLLLTHPQVNSAAVVPMPDPILGEKACAFVTLKKGESFTFEEMATFLRGKKIAVYKVPERLEVRDELPLKGHQKIAKGPLRDEIARILKEEGPRER